MFALEKWFVPIVLAAPAAAQIEEMMNVSMRVVSSEPRIVNVDHGSIDGLAANDRIVFRTRDGARLEGTIASVGDRTAKVELDDPTIVLAPGTRGDSRVPKARVAAPRPTLITPGAPTTPVEPATPEHPPWERKDEDWTSDQPLLSRMRPFRPNERQPLMTGRIYSIIDYIKDSEGDRTETFARLGTDLTYENFLRQGGTLHFDGEVNNRRTDVPDDDESGTNFRLDRFSYAFGGNRFAPDRYELGRFLQHEMPEFGVLDGLEWGRRMSNGDTFGASVGFMPEPDEDQSTGDDLQFAANYRFVVDESELLSVQAGYQKSYHDLAADRDLFIAKVLYFPPADWNFSATAWIDWYTAGDTTKDSGPEVTQAYVTTGRRFESGSSLRATYTHRAFPEVERNEFLPVTAAQLADDRSDRATLSGRQMLGRTFALTGLIGAWNDEDDTGGDAEGGFQLDDFVFDDARIDAAAFGVQGRYNTTLGWRAAIGTQSSQGFWRVGYEFTLNDIDGFTTDNDDIPQHRISTSFDTFSDSGWSLSAHADALLFDSENAILVGLFLTRSF
ncbi:MAG: hypothetical protein SGI72_10320 [Planctomycetota bacterium]|nr:hypothetical protein [Planctomycetota bacterium]